MEDEEARGAQDHPRREDRDERGVLTSVDDHVPDQLPAVVAPKQAGHPRQSADARQAEQRREFEEPEGRDRAKEVEPSTLVDEVLTARMGSGQRVREVAQEDHADDEVIALQQLPRLRVERQQEQHHDHERKQREDEDEQVVGITVLAHGHLLSVHRRSIGHRRSLGARHTPRNGWRHPASRRVGARVSRRRRRRCERKATVRSGASALACA